MISDISSLLSPFGPSLIDILLNGLLPSPLGSPSTASAGSISHAGGAHMPSVVVCQAVPAEQLNIPLPTTGNLLDILA